MTEVQGIMAGPSVRAAVCADDRWYPSDAASLQQTLDEFLAHVTDPSVPGDLMGLISPHAGYAFAGQTAAHAYKQLEGRSYDRVIVLGPNHQAGYYPGLGPQAMTRSDYYRTPLGLIPIDADAVKQIETRTGIDFLQSDQEHSLEMQLPFLQLELGDRFKLVPLMLARPFYVYGPAERSDCEALSQALLPVVDDRTLLVASSDLSHLNDYAAVRHFDEKTENLLGEFDIDKLVQYMANEGECRACGDVAIITMLLTARARGANRVKVLYRTNSSDVIGRQIPGQYTVGYMAAAVFKSAGGAD